MFGIGGFELFLILLFAFLIFGPDKLPAMAKTLGRAIAKFKEAQEGMSEQLKSTSFVDKDSDNPFKNPLDVVETAANNAKDASKKVKAEGKQVVENASAVAVAASESASAHSESFAARKAAYDAQRAARKEAEAKENARVQAAAKQAAAEPKAQVKTKSATDADSTNKSDAEAATDLPSASKNIQTNNGGDN